MSLKDQGLHYIDKVFLDIHYPAMRSIGRDINFTVCHFFHYVRLQISQPGLADQCEILQFSHISDRFSPNFGG